MAASASSVNLKTYTVCESGCDYTSVQAAETAHQQDLVANDSALTFEIQNTWTSPDGATDVNGSATDATRFITITAVGAARATATWSTTAYRAIGAFTAFNLRDGYIVLDGVQGQTTQNFDWAAAIGAGGSNSTIKNCFLRGDGVATGVLCINVGNSTLTGIIIRNNVLIEGTGKGIGVVSAAGGVTVDNNTIEDCGVGIETTADDAIIRNNIIWNTTTPLVGDFNPGTLPEENYTYPVLPPHGSVRFL